MPLLRQRIQTDWVLPSPLPEHRSLAIIMRAEHAGRDCHRWQEITISDECSSDGTTILAQTSDCGAVAAGALECAVFARTDASLSG